MSRTLAPAAGKYNGVLHLTGTGATLNVALDDPGGTLVVLY